MNTNSQKFPLYATYQFCVVNKQIMCSGCCDFFLIILIDTDKKEEI